MKALRVTIFLLLTVVSWNIDAQERIVDRSFNVWMSANLRYNLHPRWYLNSEINIRRANGFSKWQQFVARPSVHFVLSKHADFSAGYSYILSYPYSNQPIPITTPEHNIWEQAILAIRWGRLVSSIDIVLSRGFKALGNKTVKGFTPLMDLNWPNGLDID
jgi:hypothetical protein